MSTNDLLMGAIIVIAIASLGIMTELQNIHRALSRIVQEMWRANEQ